MPDVATPGPPKFKKSEPTLALELVEASLTMPRLKWSPYGSSQFTGTEKFAHCTLDGAFRSGGHAPHDSEVEVLFAGGKQSESLGVSEADEKAASDAAAKSDVNPEGAMIMVRLIVASD